MKKISVYEETSDLRESLENIMADECYGLEIAAIEEGREFNCKCACPFKMSRKEVIDLLVSDYGYEIGESGE